MYFPTALAAITALVDARNSGDIDTALACYEPDATIVAQPDLKAVPGEPKQPR